MTRLEEIRKFKGLTYQEISDKVKEKGIKGLTSPGTIRRIFIGERDLHRNPEELLEALANILEIDLEYVDEWVTEAHDAYHTNENQISVDDIQTLTPEIVKLPLSDEKEIFDYFYGKIKFDSLITLIRNYDYYKEKYCNDECNLWDNILCDCYNEITSWSDFSIIALHLDMLGFGNFLRRTKDE